jgi:cytochrome c-type biogenesis protein CcmE
VVIEGAVATDGSFAATNVLAKHDEKYMPKALVDELKAKGEWRPDEAGS